MNISKVLLATVLTSSFLIAGCAIGDDDHDDHKRGYRSSLDVAPVSNAAYSEECGDCHMAYQPGFLPARSWEKMMGNLEDHFGENAELDSETQQQLTQYMVENSAEHADYKRSKAMMKSLADNQTPLRISETRYFIRKHDELPRRLVEDNPEVSSFSRCEVCHTEADSGSYNEHQVNIPGFGQWDD